jgi:twitching motility protein PilT
MDISELLAFSVKNKASDLHLSAGLPPMIRVHGDVRRINLPPLEHKDVHGMIYDIMNDGQRKAYEEMLESTSRSRSRAGTLPRQRLQPGARRVGGAAYHSVQDPELEELNAPKILPIRAEAARPGAGDRPDRLRQVDHAGGHGQPPQRKRIRPHPDD